MTGRSDPAQTLPTRRLTFLMDIIAGEAIRANDGIFQRELGMTIRELRVLRVVDDNAGIGFEDIQRVTGLDRRSVAAFLRKHLGAGLLAREAGTFHSTTAGKALRDRGRAVSDSLEELLLGPLTRSEREAIFSQLEMLALWVRSDTYHKTLDHYLASLPPEKGTAG